MNITIDEFKEKYLPKLQDEYHEQFYQNYSKNLGSYQEKVKKQLETFFGFLKTYQEKMPVDIGEIQLSILYISMVEESPRLAITAYDYNGMLGEELLTAQFKVPWMYEGMKEYREAIEAKLKELKATNTIHKSAVKQLLLDEVHYLQACFYSSMKYALNELHMLEGYDEVQWAEESVVTVGSYKDWRAVVYKGRPPIDIFFRNPDTSLDYRRFDEAVYSKLAFKDLDLQHAFFYGCEFVHASFENVDFKDAIFDHCRFYHCKFKDVKVAGATVSNSVVKKCEFSNIEKSADGIYKPFELNEVIREACTVKED